MMDEAGIVRRQHLQHQHLAPPAAAAAARASQHLGGGGSRLLRDSSGECVSSSEDELAGETLYEAPVIVHCRKKSGSSSKGVQFDQDASERILQLQGDQLKLKKKDKIKSKVFVYYVWVRRNISDYVPCESHRLKDESLAVIAGWYKDLLIVTFATAGEKESFLTEFQKVNRETLRRLYGEQDDISEQCALSLGGCLCGSTASAVPDASPSPPQRQLLTVKPYETANDVARKCKSAFRLEASQKALLLWLDDDSAAGHCLVGCESIFATVLYQIHQRHKSGKRRGSVLSDASSTSPNESNSLDLDESFTREAAKVGLSLHSRDTCAASCCSGAKKKRQHQQRHYQLRRTSEVPNKIRSWIASSRKSQLIRQGSTEALSAVGREPDAPLHIIGRSLSELYPSGTVSRPVTCLLAQVYHRCYLARGIFRQCGSVAEKNQVLQLLGEYDPTTRNDNMRKLNDFGEYCIADALKNYLRDLPGCLLQRSLTAQWFGVLSDPSSTEQQQKAVPAISGVIRQMQPQNAHLLHMLMLVLKRVAEHHDQNQMTAANIGGSVSFSVLDVDPPGGSLEALEQVAKQLNKLIELMISRFADIWPDERANAQALGDFVHHISPAGSGDELISSMESLVTDAGGGARAAEAATEPLSLSSVSKDSGLQLSDQQLDDTRKAAAPPVTIPERSQPPPYDIVMKRQQQQQQHQSRQHRRDAAPRAEATAVMTPTTPRRERPPVPARLHRRPASVGPSGRKPLTAAGTSSAANSMIDTSTIESKARHPLSSSVVIAAASDAGRPSRRLEGNSGSPGTPVRGSVAVAATAATAAQRQPRTTASPLSRFRKRSSSETRLELLGSPAQPPAQSVPLQQHQHQQQHQLQHQATDAARQRRLDFERFSRLHGSRDSRDFNNGGDQQHQVLLRQFSSRHAPIRVASLAAASVGGVGGRDASPRPRRPRTRLPEELEMKLADQKVSFV